MNPDKLHVAKMTKNLKKLAPILLFTYKKIAPLKRTVEALLKNELASASELFIFSDGPKSGNDLKEINEVRAYLNTLTGFKKITIKTEPFNKGLASSIIGGVSEILESYESVIVLEDDLITSSNFLNFMNDALTHYGDEERVLSIAGYTVPIQVPASYEFDTYFTQRASSWGWATWSDRWNEIDWSVSDYETFIKDRASRKRFNRMGSDLTGMLNKQMKGKINSWAIRFCYHQFKSELYTVFPTVSKVSNIGFGEDATHTKGAQSRYATVLDKTDKKKFALDMNPSLHKDFVRQFVKTYSLQTRANNKIKKVLGI